MQTIGRAGYVAAVAAGWTGYVRRRLSAWNRRHDGAWWPMARPEWRSPAQLLDLLRDGLCGWPGCDEPGTLAVGRSQVCWNHYREARREREAGGATYRCYVCGRVTPTASLGGLVELHELCVVCSRPAALRLYWTRPVRPLPRAALPAPREQPPGGSAGDALGIGRNTAVCAVCAACRRGGQ